MVVKRSHTVSNIAPAIRTLLAQINAQYPNRKKDSDGIWPSPAHTAANPTSDHEAGNALDITDNLGNGKRVDEVVAALVKSGDPRIHYVIHDGRIWSDGEGWRAYHGSNQHEGHMHLSIYESKRKDASRWAITPRALKTATRSTGTRKNSRFLSGYAGWSITEGKRYPVVGERGSWTLLQGPLRTGWVPSKYLK